MTGKRLYNTVAEMLRQIEDTPYGEKTIRREIAEGLCDAFKADNPAFDRQRFLTACGF